MDSLTPAELRTVKKAIRDAYAKGRAAERREFDAFLSRMRALKELNGSADSFLKAYSPGERAKGRAVEMEHTADPADNPHDLVAEAMLAHAEESLSTGADPLPGLDRLRDLLDDPAALADLLGQSGADDATVGKCFRVLKGFDESKVHRDHGKFASKGSKLAREVSDTLGEFAKHDGSGNTHEEYTAPAASARRNALAAVAAAKDGYPALAREYHKDAADAHDAAAEGHDGWSGRDVRHAEAARLHRAAAARHRAAAGIVQKAWEESKHPREHGKFASASGMGGEDAPGRGERQRLKIDVPDRYDGEDAFDVPVVKNPTGEEIRVKAENLRSSNPIKGIIDDDDVYVWWAEDVHHQPVHEALNLPGKSEFENRIIIYYDRESRTVSVDTHSPNADVSRWAKANGFAYEPDTRVAKAVRNSIGWGDRTSILKAWNEADHPRGKGGHFISKDRIEAAKTDPKLAKELRAEVKPEDAGKLDAALEGKADLGRTKRGQAKHEAAARRATRDEAKAKTQEFLKHFQKVGDLKAELTADHLYDLAEHLKSEHVTIDDVRQLRTALHGAGGGRASFGGQRKRQALVDALRDHARGRGLKERAKELGLDGGELSAAVGTRDAGEPAPAAGAAGGRQAPATTGQYGAWGRAVTGDGAPVQEAAPKGEPAAEQPADGSNVKPVELTRGQIADLLANPGDRYRDVGHKKDELKGENRRTGDPIYGYSHAPEHFARSDATGRPIRHYVKLPDGQTVHPDELRDAISRGRVKVVQSPAEQTQAAKTRAWNQAIRGKDHLHTRQQLTDLALAAKVPAAERSQILREHRASIEKQLTAGEYVPAEVLADYPDLAPAPPAAPAAAPPAPAPTTGVAADEAELATLNRTPAKKLTPGQKKRKDQLSRESTARKFPGATPVMTGGGKGPGVSDAENESTAAKPTSPATTVDTPAGADYSSGTPAPVTGGTSGGAKVETYVVGGDTYANKDAIKAAGGKWDGERKVWTVPEGASLPMGLTVTPQSELDAMHEPGRGRVGGQVVRGNTVHTLRAAKSGTVQSPAGPATVHMELLRGHPSAGHEEAAAKYPDREQYFDNVLPHAVAVHSVNPKTGQPVSQTKMFPTAAAAREFFDKESARIQGGDSSPPPAPGGTQGGGKVETTTAGFRDLEAKDAAAGAVPKTPGDWDAFRSSHRAAVDAAISAARADHTPDEFRAIARQLVGPVSGGPDRVADALRQYLTAVTRTIESQKV